MNPVEIKNTIEAIIQGLEPLEQKLSVPLGFLWQVAIRQVYVDLVTDILFFIVFLFGVYFWIRLFRYYQKNENNLEENTKEMMFIFALGLLVFCCVFFYAIALIIEAPKALLNPEFEAINKILNLLKIK
jgi:formate hydrogenlyase subunit 3/multisubunit Na+/H+ antiporter MnhD subunit